MDTISQIEDYLSKLKAWQHAQKVNNPLVSKPNHSDYPAFENPFVMKMVFRREREMELGR